MVTHRGPREQGLWTIPQVIGRTLWVEKVPRLGRGRQDVGEGASAHGSSAASPPVPPRSPGRRRLPGSCRRHGRNGPNRSASSSTIAITGSEARSMRSSRPKGSRLSALRGESTGERLCREVDSHGAHGAHGVPGPRHGPRARHLQRLLATYVEHYNRERPHRGLDLHAPEGGPQTAEPASERDRAPRPSRRAVHECCRKAA
jgi:hypothetical protein